MSELAIIVLLVISTVGVFAVQDLKPLTPEQVERLAAWREGDQKMWELSGQTEGDMVLHPQQKNGIIGDRYRWTNNEIPYEIDSVFSEAQANTIHGAVKEFAAKSCVTVRPKTSDDVDYVYVTGENTGCWSKVGRRGEKQELNLQPNGCIWVDIINHEFLHAAGFYHQQSATERDDYVSIVWENIQSGKEHNFDKYDESFITNLGTPYDYGSIMHYTETAFSVNGQPTIVPTDESWIGKLGKGTEMSDIDVQKLKLMYNCP